MGTLEDLWSSAEQFGIFWIDWPLKSVKTQNSLTTSPLEWLVFCRSHGFTRTQVTTSAGPHVKSEATRVFSKRKRPH